MKRTSTILLLVLSLALIASLFYIKNADTPPPLQNTISGVVVPHHDIVKDTRSALFAEVSKYVDSPDTVILVSPNHFNTGPDDIQVSDQPWKTISGEIEPNVQLIRALASTAASLQPRSFLGEHGITAILTDIKQYFPESKIVPIILKRGVTEERLLHLSTVLTKECKHCIMVASVDFSHEQPALLADLHDVVSIRSLENLDVSTLLQKTEVDSPESLALLVMWAKNHATYRFKLFEHTNAGFLSLDGDQGITTHVFGWYETGEKTQPRPSATFLIVGDVMFARGVANRFRDDLAESLDGVGDRFFWGTDASVVNMEGAISTRPIQIFDDEDNGYTFVFAPESARVLRAAGVTMASLANNHSNNAGGIGLSETKETLRVNNIQWFGGPATSDTNEVGSFSGQGINVAIIGVNTFAPVPDITDQIRKLKLERKKVIVFVHWGVEYMEHHSEEQALMAHDWIDAGADLVVGSHPHMVQEVEVYRGKPIVYSLGNFLFDQNFSEETQRGMALAGEFNDDGLMLFALPTESHGLKPQLSLGEKKQSRLSDFYTPWQEYKVERLVGVSYFFPY